MNITCYKFENW